MRFDGFYFLFICLLSVSGFFKASFLIPYFLDMDIEDCMNKRSPLAPKNVAKAKNVPVITTKRNRENSQDSDEDLTKSWRQVLGNPPSRKTNVKEWVLGQEFRVSSLRILMSSAKFRPEKLKSRNSNRY